MLKNSIMIIVFYYCCSFFSLFSYLYIEKALLLVTFYKHQDFIVCLVSTWPCLVWVLFPLFLDLFLMYLLFLLYFLDMFLDLVIELVVHCYTGPAGSTSKVIITFSIDFMLRRMVGCYNNNNNNNEIVYY